MKFKNFPRVTCISLKESVARRMDLINQLRDRGIHNYKIVECFDGRSTNYLNHPIVTGPFINSTESEVIATSMSHVKAIHDWYTTTEDEIGFFCEDDIKFNISDDWNFAWDEFVSRLPRDWKIMQLALIRSTPLSPSDMKLHEKKWDDWSCCAYLLTRAYAKQLLNDYYQNGVFTLDIKYTNHIPLPENIVYTSDYVHSYTVPLFTENRIHKSTLIREETYDSIEKIQSDSCAYIIDWWKNTGSKLSIDELMDTKPKWDISNIGLVNINNEKKENLSMNKKIPVIGTAVVNNTYWVSRLLMSVDYPVETFVIINNNGRGIIDEELNNLTKIKHKFIDNIKVVHMPGNIGCSGAWNLIIKCYMNAAYWIIANDDVAFNPGLLEEMFTIVNSNEQVGTIHPNRGDYDIGAWDLFLIRDTVINQLGLFDENCYPAYCEDADYIMRIHNSSVVKIVGTNKSYQHGHGDSKDYYENGSQTMKSEVGLKQKLDKANSVNIEYLTKKWGPGWRTVNPSAQPFQNDTQHHIGETRYDLDFVRSKHMGF